MLSQSTVNSLGNQLSDFASSYGVDLTPKTATMIVDGISMKVGNAYNTLTNYFPNLQGYLSSASSLLFDEAEPKSLAEYSIDLARDDGVQTNMNFASNNKVEEDDDEYLDCLPEECFFKTDDAKTLPDVVATTEPKVEKEEKPVSKPEVKPEVKQKSSGKKQKSASRIGFGAHVPGEKSRKEGMTGGEYMDMFSKNIRHVKDPLRIKGSKRKVKNSGVLDRLSQPKARTADRYPSNHDIDMKFKNSLRGGK